MNKIFSILIAGFLVIGVFVAPVSAQGVNDGSVNTQAGAIDNDNGFSLWWILPLLAIPVLYYVFKNPEERGDNYYGVKGGRSEKKDEETEEDDIVLDDDINGLEEKKN